jgi:hypothetical protein
VCFNYCLLFIDDTTRVVLTGGETGDYINANLVHMEIPGSGIINRYIATQGTVLTINPLLLLVFGLVTFLIWL